MNAENIAKERKKNEDNIAMQLKIVEEKAKNEVKIANELRIAAEETEKERLMIEQERIKEEERLMELKLQIEKLGLVLDNNNDFSSKIYDDDRKQDNIENIIMDNIENII